MFQNFTKPNHSNMPTKGSYMCYLFIFNRFLLLLSFVLLVFSLKAKNLKDISIEKKKTFFQKTYILLKQETASFLKEGDVISNIKLNNFLQQEVATSMFSSSCNCTNYLYVNDPTLDLTHKFELNTDGSIGSEIGSTWVGAEVINNPHGVVADLNGNLYISQINQTGDAAVNQLFKLDCDGNVIDDNFIPDWLYSYNLTSIGNTLYAVGQNPTSGVFEVVSYDLCTKASINTLTLPNNIASWGLTLGKDGNLYITSSWAGYGGNHIIYRVDTDLNAFTPVATINNNDSNNYALGVAQDEHLNWFMVTFHAQTGATTIYKINSSGNLVHSITDSTLDKVGFGGAWGITYSEDVGKLYVGTLADDCVAVIDAGGATGNHSYIPNEGIPHVPATYSKAINILKECCPTDNNLTIDTTLCVGAIGEILFLQDLINCEGTICEGMWQEGGGNTGLTYNSCNNSITINSLEACGTFSLNSDGTGNNPLCGAFTITVNIEVATVIAPVIAGNQTLCEDDTPTGLTVTTPATGAGTITYQWQSSTTSCEAGFTNILNETNTTYTPPIDLSETTYYRLITTNTASCSSGNCEDLSNCLTVIVDNDCDPCELPLSPGMDVTPDCSTGIAGIVYKDLNFDGINNDNQGGFGGIEVSAYDCNGDLVGSATTDVEGEYQITSTTTGEAYRIEFNLPAQITCYAQPTFLDGENSLVQFQQAGTCIDLGLYDSNDCLNPLFNIGSDSHYDGKLFADGMGFVTCGTLVQSDPNDRYTFGVFDIRSLAFGNDRPINNLGDYHHPSWRVDSIGNVFGLTQDNNKNIYATASAHYGAGYGFISSTREAVVQYGEIGGGAADLGAAGTIYKIDAYTGQATVFTQLPQLAANLININCEGSERVERNTGPALGNIDHDSLHNQFFVTNFEDGKIYRVGADGTTLSTFDPFDADNGAPGIASDKKPYGVTVNLTHDKVFFGTLNFDLDPELYSIDLDENGDFTGVPQYHTSLQGNGEIGGPFVNNNWVAISDLEFTPEGTLVAGIRTGCFNLLGSSHNHGGTYHIMESTGGDGIFDDLHDNPRIHYRADPNGPDDGYGGIGIWKKEDGTFDYLISSADIVQEDGPHGLLIFPHDYTTTGNNSSEYILRPAATISYLPSYDGTSGPGEDFKGIGGDVVAMSACDPLPLEIGNYVWEDFDADGIQDACEKGLTNVTVKLYDENCTLIGLDVTDENGYYTFNFKNVDSTGIHPDGTAMTHFNALNPNTQYYLVLGKDGTWDTAKQSVSINGESYKLTLVDEGDKDNIDSDATVGMGCGFGEAPFIAVTTGDFGSIDHTSDFGLTPGCKLSVSYQQNTCVDNGNGTFTATMDVQVIYQFPNDPSDNIIIGLDGNTQSIATSGNNTDTLNAQINLAADGTSGHQLFAHFAADDCCGDTLLIKAPVPCVPDVTIDCSNKIAGVAFIDSDFDGINNNTGGIAGIKVFAYDCENSLVDSTWTDADGEYLLPNTTTEVEYRIEFDIPDFILCDYKPTQIGTNNGTTIQFAQAGTCVDLGLGNPASYCGDEKFLITPCYIYGDNTGNQDIVVKWPYTNEGTITTDKVAVTNAHQAASLWGLAYEQKSSSLFASAIVKAHAGLHEGANGGGLDAIYLINPFSAIANGEVWLELTDDLGIDVGNIPSNTDRGLENSPNNDPEAFTKAGKVGIGDIEISEDGKTLYVMNLFDKTVYAIDIATKSIVNTFPIPDPECTNGTYRPWALGFRNGSLYAGAICDGSAAAPSPPTVSDKSARAFLEGFVYKLEGGTFTEILSFPLDYDREPPFGYSSGTCTSGIDGWYGWVDELQETCENGIIAYPQPILTDLEFDDSGNLILGFTDRTGFQIGYGNYGPTGTALYSTYSGGDILFACNDGADNWSFENPTSCTNANGGAIGGTNNTYPSYIFDNGYSNIGEYFVGDFFSDGGDLVAPPWFPGHAEITTGGLAISGNEVVSTAYDPVTGAGGLYNRGGVIKLSTESGRRTTQGYELYSTDAPEGAGTAGKGVGLGDLELLCAPAPIEIGNYVWEDTDKDGIQDACEVGIDNIKIRLFDEDCNLIGLTTTTNGGQYSFNQTNVDPTGVSNTGEANNSFSGLLTNTNYYIRLGDENTWNISNKEIIVNGVNYQLTATDNGTNDEIDNDAQIGTGCGFEESPFIFVETGDAGCMIHNVDIGLFSPLSLGNQVWADLNNNGLIDDGEPGIDSVELQLFALGTDGEKGGNDDILIDSTFTDSLGMYHFSPLDSGTYYVKIVGGIPTGMVSSTGTGADGNSTADYEPGPMTDSNVNNDDDGTQMETMIMSDTIQLTLEMEPTDDGDTNKNSNLSVDFGLIHLLSIGNLVWEDENNDGLNNNDEAGIDGITVYLLDDGDDDIKGNADDNIIDSVITAAGGQYLFDSLYPGEYYVKLNSGIPDGMISSTAKENNTLNTEPAADPDSDDLNNDDNGTQMGTMVMSELVSLTLSDEPINDGDVDSTTNLAVDFGLFTPLSIGNLVWKDNNNNGQFDSETESGIEEIELILFSVGADGVKGGGDDVQIALDTTDTDGNYLFDTLIAGNYYVKINSGIPDGLISSTGAGKDGSGKSTYEPSAHTDINVNNDDDGTQMGAMVMSDTLNLTKNTEPTNDGDTDKNTNLSVDFGLIPMLSLGNLVWTDTNNDGLNNNGETGIDDIKVQLFTAGTDDTKGTDDDVLLDSMITAEGGLYLFDSLAPGEYYVKLIDLNSGLISSTGEGTNIISGAGTFEPAADPDNTDNNDDDSGIQMGYGDTAMVMSNLVSLILNEEPTNDGDTDSTSNLSVDFGLLQTMSVGNLVFEDLDNSGTTDLGEPGIEAVEMILYKLGPDGEKGTSDDIEIKRDTTDADGNYLFEYVTQGTYFVKINSGIPTDMYSSTGTGAAGTNDNISEPFTGTDNNVDNNDDGTQMIMAGQLMVMSDTFQIQSYTEPTDDSDSDNNTNLSIDFGLIRLLSIGNLVWEDNDNDGLNNNGEVGIDGIEVQLISDGGDGIKGNENDTILESMLTTNGGQYLFDSLYPGDYYIKLNNGIPSGMHSSTGEGTGIFTGSGTAEPAADPDLTDTNDDDSGIQMGTPTMRMVMSDLVTLSLSDESITDGDVDSTSNLAVDFGLYQTISVGNLVWEDLNNDGIADSDEPGVDSVEVQIYNIGADGEKSTADDLLVQTDTTDINGAYNFTFLGQGTYYVKLVNLTYTTLVSSNGAGTLGKDPITFEPGAMTDNDVDNNDDGSQMGAMVMSDTFQLVKNIEPVTDSDLDSNTNFTIDFGLVQPLELGNLVWEDLNNNGTVDEGEPGIDGVEVMLYWDGNDGIKGNENDTLITSMFTANGGKYLFNNLYPGEYYLKLNQGIPAHFISASGEGTEIVSGTGAYETAPDPDVMEVDNDDNGSQIGLGDTAMIMSDLVTLEIYNEPKNDGDTLNTTNYNLDFGLYHTLSIGNLVWEDLNNNGTVDTEESGMEGVEVVLYQPGTDGIKGTDDDIQFARDTTDTHGNYLFEDLYPNNYYLVLESGIPANMVSSTGEGNIVAAGTGAYETAPDPDNNINNNDDGTGMQVGSNRLIMSDILSLGLYDEPTNDGDVDSTTNLTVDFGLFETMSIGNLVWEDLNNDGVADASESKMEGIVVTLFKDGGDGIKMSADDINMGNDTTDSNGHYLFDNLYPGDYYLKIIDLPYGMISSTGEGINSTTTNGAYEPAPDADINTDNLDDGIFIPTEGGMIMSTMVSLNLYDEPINDGDTENNTNLSVDFGLFQTLILGNLVWEDLNNNGLADENEPGMEGIEVILFRDYDGIKGGNDDVEIDKDTTDENGNYLFANLNAGMYYIKLSDGIPSGFMSSTGEGTGFITGEGPYEPAPDADVYMDMDDNGTQMYNPDGSIMVMSELISMVLYNEQTDSIINMDVDFGLYNTLEAGNLVWEDLNNNGMVDAGEPGIEGIEVILYQTTDNTKANSDDVEIGRDTTDEDGMYIFQTIEPGDYWVKLNSNIPTGFYSSTGEGINTVTGAGLFEPSSMVDDNIDDNDDGTQIGLGHNIMIESDIVSLDLYGEPDIDDTFDSTANYRIDFGLYETIDLGNSVWEDYDNDGMKDEEEPGFPNITVALAKPGPDGLAGTDDDIEMGRDTTDENGAYLFEYLNPNEYFVTISNIPDGFNSSSGEGVMNADGTGTFEPAADPDNDIDNDDDGTEMYLADGTKVVRSDIFNLALYTEPTTDEDTDNSTNFAVDFGLYESLEIGNLVWEDLNNDGILNNGEPGIDSIEIVLFKAGPDSEKGTADDLEIGRDTTDSHGTYEFIDLYPGEYFVQLTSGIPAHFASSTGEGTVLADGTGTTEPAADPDEDINGNDDGTQMGNPDGGLIVTSDLVSLHLYKEPLNDGDVDSTTNFDIDFGLFELLSIGNAIWEDYNNNGHIDEGEPSIENVEVVLYKDGGDEQTNSSDDIEIARMMTDSAGKYRFDDLYPGEYFVQLANNIPYNMVSATGEGIYLVTGSGSYESPETLEEDIDNDDNGLQTGSTISTRLVSLELYNEPTNDGDASTSTNFDVDLGLIRTIDLGGTVWFDRTNDGDIGIGEYAMEDIEVVLNKPGEDGMIGTTDDICIDTMMTDKEGQYLFNSIFPDVYYLRLQNVPSWVASSDGNGFGAYTGVGPLEEGGMSDMIDSDDNGIQIDKTTIVSDLFDIILYQEPVNDGDELNYTNTSLDFALTPLHYARIFDPCNCLSNESAPGAGDGQFDETITILSTVENQTWSLISNTGMFTEANQPVPLGTVAIPNGREGSFFKYELKIRHYDNQGYSAVFESTNGELSISNFCQYDGSCRYELATSPDGTPGAPQLSSAQNFITAVTNTPRVDTMLNCDDKSRFMDDGLVDGLYTDTTARDNQHTICPQNQWQRLTFTFTEFSTAAGDILYVHDGANISAPLIGKYEGEGVSQTTGWVAANCDPDINPTGCLTFRFVTNGDNNKSNGWHANIACTDREIILTPPNNLNEILACEASYAVLAINPATVTADCGTVQDSQIVRIFNQHEELCLNTCLASTDMVTKNFAIGQYRVEYKLKSDTVKTTEAIMTVQAPSLVCNDVINVPLGSACGVLLTPDDLLENPCDTITNTLYYYITLKGIDDKGNIVSLATGGGKDGAYPMVSKDMIAECGGTITAEIERRYYDGLNLTFCNNGVQSASCEVTVNLLDQTPPVFADISTIADTFRICPVDLTADALGLPTPTAIDNCDTATVEFVDATILNDGGSCDTTRALLNWKATDVCGNETTFAQSVVILRPQFTDIVKPADIVLSCGEDEESTLNDISKTGIPSIKVGKVVNGVLIPTDTIALDTADYVCGYILQKNDVSIPADCGTKLFRYWEILDWCSSQTGVQHICTQQIELTDTLAPTFVDQTLPTETIHLAHDACTLDITKLENPIATDNCSEVAVRIDSVFRVEDGTNWGIHSSKLTSLDCDSFLVRWVAEDACHEQTVNDTITQLILIEDNTAPIAACVDKINLSLGQNDAKIHYNAFDGGSYDACGIVKYEVSRDEVNWDSTVVFNCSDAHLAITVYLRVTDKKGNQSTCWMTVNVEDKIAPICSDLPDMAGTCEEEHLADLGASTDVNENGLLDDEWVDMTDEQIEVFNTKYGNPNCSDNISCGALVVQQQYQLANKNCGQIAIQRRFRAIDWDGKGRTSNWSTQHINIESEAAWAVTLPVDWKGNCGDNVPNSEAIITNGTCDLVAVEVEEKVFETVEDACLKVVRTFTIINWCNYEDDQPTIKITRTENQFGSVTEARTITAAEFANAGKLEYVQILKLQDDTAPIITLGEVDNCIESTDCKATKRFAITASDCNIAATLNLVYNWTISVNSKQLATGEGSFFEYEVAPNVNYKVNWTVADKCGNTAKESANYEFKDCKKPAPYCLNGTVVELMPEVGSIQIWAKDIERGSSDNCTTPDRLIYKVWHANLGETPTDLADVQALPEVITFDCATLGQQTVNLYVIDEAGNWDFCTTYIIVQDNRNACENTSTEGMAIISGTTRDWKGKAVEEVQVQVANSSSMMTQADGFYNFELAMNNRYVIQPKKNEQPLNGVTTFDLVLISKHILGIKKFGNPYQMIAADANASGSITAFDMVQIRQLILNIKTAFKNNESWRFVDAAYEFSTDSPLTANFPEVIQINNLQHDMEMDFVAVKVGDVNGSAQPNSLVQAEDRTTTNTFEITTADKVLKTGETYSLAFSTKQLTEIQGYQFTLGYDDLKLEKLHSGVAGIDNFGLHKMDEGMITTSWNQSAEGSMQLAEGSEQLAGGSNLQSSIVLFNIEFTALKDGKLSEQLSLLNRPTVIEAYEQNNELMDIQLTFTTPLSNDKFELFQNQPNPFHDRTLIGFYLPGDSEVQLVLRDETGRVLKTFKENRKEGYNTIQLEEEELTNGFIYYQLSTKFGTKAKKMLQLK